MTMEFIIPSIVEVLLLDKLGDVDMPELCGLRDKRTCGRLPRPRRSGHENVGLPSIKLPSNYHTLLLPLLQYYYYKLPFACSDEANAKDKQGIDDLGVLGVRCLDDLETDLPKE